MSTSLSTRAPELQLAKDVLASLKVSRFVAGRMKAIMRNIIDNNGTFTL